MLTLQELTGPGDGAAGAGPSSSPRCGLSSVLSGTCCPLVSVVQLAQHLLLSQGGGNQATGIPVASCLLSG